MRRLKTFVVAGGAITPDTDWLALDGAPTDEEILKVRVGAKGVELVALVTTAGGAPKAAVGDIDYQVIERMREGSTTRVMLADSADALAVGTQTVQLATGGARHQRAIAIRVSDTNALAGDGILEIWAREA